MRVDLLKKHLLGKPFKKISEEVGLSPLRVKGVILKTLENLYPKQSPAEVKVILKNIQKFRTKTIALIKLYERDMKYLSLGEVRVLKESTDSEFDYEASIKKRIYDFQEKFGFDTTFDLILDDLHSLIKEVKSSAAGSNFIRFSREELDILKAVIDFTEANWREFEDHIKQDLNKYFEKEREEKTEYLEGLIDDLKERMLIHDPDWEVRLTSD